MIVGVFFDTYSFPFPFNDSILDTTLPKGKLKFSRFAFGLMMFSPTNYLQIKRSLPKVAFFVL